MAGIESITSLIKQEATENAEKIISEAKNTANEILADAKKAADEKSKAALISEKAESDAVISKAKSAAELQKRRDLLCAKQEIITEIIEKAKKTLSSLPDKEYFELLIKLVKKYETGQEGVLALGANDLKRVPSDFAESLKKASGGKLTLSKEPINIKNGFLLLYGGIDINCSFDSLFDENLEELTDKVSAIVFA